MNDKYMLPLLEPHMLCVCFVYVMLYVSQSLLPDYNLIKPFLLQLLAFLTPSGILSPTSLAFLLHHKCFMKVVLAFTPQPLSILSLPSNGSLFSPKCAP